uniref:Uncharacterized protein n=1 Tax=Romanomermis culicivorax TaxID=13658 RepID=A0A915HYX9_ROMCU
MGSNLGVRPCLPVVRSLSTRSPTLYETSRAMGSAAPNAHQILKYNTGEPSGSPVATLEPAARFFARFSPSQFDFIPL